MGNQAAPFYVNEAINMEEKIVSARGNILIVSSIHPDDATAVKPQSKFTQGRTAQEQITPILSAFPLPNHVCILWLCFLRWYHALQTGIYG